MSKYALKQVRRNLGAPKTWTHYVSQRCPDENCPQGQQSQGAVRDEYGEDINLFETIKEWKQGLEDKPCLCGCGKREIVTYRHALADYPNAKEFWRQQEVIEA